MISRIRTWLTDTFTSPTATSPLPPHVANLRLDMNLIGIHMEQARREPDPRTRSGYIQTTNKEYKS